MPLRFIAQALNITLWWDASTSTAVIRTDMPYSGTLEERSPGYFMMDPLLQEVMETTEGYKMGAAGNNVYFSQNGENFEIRIEPVREDMFCITVLPHGESKVVDTALERAMQVFLGEEAGSKAFNFRESLSFGFKFEEWFGGKRVYFIKDTSEYITIYN